MTCRRDAVMIGVMITLAADTSTPYNSVVLCDGETVLAESVVKAGRRHSERLMATVDWILAEAATPLDSVELLAISQGPGSFTGLRVGIAAWKGLALANGLPLAGVPTLDAMARSAIFHRGLICPLLDARMSEIFGAVYESDGAAIRKRSDDRVGPIGAFLEGLEDGVLFLGDGALLYRETIQSLSPGALFAPDAYSAPRASNVALEGLALLASGAASDGAAIDAVYLRKSQAEEARNASNPETAARRETAAI